MKNEAACTRCGDTGLILFPGTRGQVACDAEGCDALELAAEEGRDELAALERRTGNNRIIAELRDELEHAHVRVQELGGALERVRGETARMLEHSAHENDEQRKSLKVLEGQLEESRHVAGERLATLQQQAARIAELEAAAKDTVRTPVDEAPPHRQGSKPK